MDHEEDIQIGCNEGHQGGTGAETILIKPHELTVGKLLEPKIEAPDPEPELELVFDCDGITFEGLIEISGTTKKKKLEIKDQTESKSTSNSFKWQFESDVEMADADSFGAADERNQPCAYADMVAYIMNCTNHYQYNNLLARYHTLENKLNVEESAHQKSRTESKGKIQDLEDQLKKTVDANAILAKECELLSAQVKIYQKQPPEQQYQKQQEKQLKYGCKVVMTPIKMEWNDMFSNNS